MKFQIILSIIVNCLMLQCCEVDPDISMEGKPSPVIYSAINKFDSIHYVIVTKTFSGDGGGTLVNARIWDSIYFTGVKVWGEFYKYSFSDSLEYPIREIRIIDGIENKHIEKLPGIFLHPKQQIFQLEGSLNEYTNGNLNILIPNYDTIRKEIKLIDKPRFNNPNKYSGTGVKILKDDPLRIRWDGSISSDIELLFVVKTKTARLVFNDTLVFNRYSRTHDIEGGFTLMFYYDQLTGLFSQFLSTDNRILSRTISQVIIVVATASITIDPSEYRNESFIDYYPISSADNKSVYGKIFSRATDTLKGLELHYLTKEAISSDPQLSVYRFTIH